MLILKKLFGVHLKFKFNWASCIFICSAWHLCHGLNCFLGRSREKLLHTLSFVGTGSCCFFLRKVQDISKGSRLCSLG